MNKPLLIVFGLALLAAAVGAGFWLRGKRQRSAEELLAAAMSGADRTQKEIAVVELVDLGPSGAAGLRQLLRESSDESVRASAIDGLARLADFESMDDLLDAMEDESTLVRARAGVAVARMLGKDRRFQADAAPAERQKIVKYSRDDWESMRSSPYFASYKQRFAQR